MKKVLCSFLCIASMLWALLGYNVENYYADEGVSLSVSASTVKVGDEVSVTISIPNDFSATIDFVFPKDLLSYEGASISANNIGTTQLANGRINLNLSDIMNLTSVTLKFKATLEGTANIVAEVIKAGNNITEETVNWSNVSKSIVVEKPAPPVSEQPQPPKKSDDNSLVSLKLSAGTLSPTFKGNVTKYTATVGYDVTKVVVSAKTSDSKASIESVTGNGTVDLKVGENVIKIVVKAENGVSATYTITVTRKAQDVAPPQPSESESSSDTELEENDALKWNGEQLHVVNKIPTESIPTAFESKLLVVNGQQMQGLSFTKGDLTVLYLNNTNGAGSLYVYDEEKNTIYPFIKIDSEKSFVMVLSPDEKNAPVPEGFASCTLSIEGKGVVNAYQLQGKAKTSGQDEFYLIYCMNNNGQKGWYMYDSVEATFQRYFPTAISSPVGGDSSPNIELQDEYEHALKALNEAKNAQYITIAIATAIIVILIVVILVLIAKVRSGESFFDAEDEDDSADEYEALEEIKEEVKEETIEVVEANDEEDDEIEIEFYHIEEAIVKETEEIEKQISEIKDDDDSDLEFIDFD